MSSATSNKARDDQLAAGVLISPTLVLSAIFIIGPVIFTVWRSFFAFGLTSSEIEFVGVDNYVQMVGDPIFWTSFKNNLFILVGSLVLQVGGGTIFAAILDRGIRRGRTFFRTVIFAPMVVSTVAVGLLWSMIYDPNVGLLDSTLRALSLPTPQLGWLGDPDLVIVSVLIVASWQFTGFMVVLILAGMQSIPTNLYEAARLDGAGPFHAFWHITLPGVWNVLVVASLITMIGAFKVFDLIYVLTQGGPGNSSQVLGSYIYYNAFSISRMGYANAIAVVLMAFAIALGILQFKISRRA